MGSKAQDVGGSGKNSLSKNSAWLVAVNIFVSLVQLVTVRYVYRWLGESAYAIYVLVMAYSGYASLFSPSVLYGVQKRLVERYQAGDHEGALRFQRAQATIVPILIAVAVLALLGLGLIFEIPNAHIGRAETFWLFAIGSVILASGQINQLLVPILAALEMFRSLAIRTACEKVAGAVVGAALAYRYHSPMAVLIGTAAGNVVSVLINLISLRQSGRDYTLRPGLHPEEIKDLQKFGSLGYPHRILSGIANSADRILYSYSGRPLEEVSRYTVAYRAPEMIQMMFVFAADAAVPRLTREMLEEPKAAAGLLDRAGRAMLLVGTALVMVPCGFGRTLLHAWLGEVPPDAAATMALLGLYFALQMYMAAMSKAFYASGRLHKAAAFTGFNALASLVLTIPLARWGGIVGVGAMNAGIALAQFVPYAFWIKSDCMPEFDVTSHIGATVRIVLLGVAITTTSYLIDAQSIVRERPLLGFAFAVLASLASAFLMLRLRLASVPTEAVAGLRARLPLRFRQS